ncbi:MAG: acyltransferase [Clostridia bacterium]|nr:acyltransferase [Clostridia bacterium]
MLLFIDRIIQKLKRQYRKSVFCKRIKCKHRNINLVGNITLINTNITIGENVTLYPEVMFYGDGPIVIGDDVSIGNGTILYASKNGGITIGSGTMIAAQTYVIDCDHGIKAGIPVAKQENTVRSVNIGADVWLGTNVTVLKGSDIASGAIIGAKALVKGEIPENAIAVGVPAKVLKYRE